MKARRVLLSQLWLMVEAAGQIPVLVKVDIIRLSDVSACMALEVMGLPKLFRVVTWVRRKLGFVSWFVFVFA
jgi:hypothetical protein